METKELLPEWMPNNQSKFCLICGDKFSKVFKEMRRHHCRQCGRLVCDKCSLNRCQIGETLYNGEKVRVCDECFKSRQRNQAEKDLITLKEKRRLDLLSKSSIVHDQSSLLRIFTLDGSFKTVFYNEDTTANHICEKVMGSSELGIVLFEVKFDFDDVDGYTLITPNMAIHDIIERWKREELVSAKIVVPVNHPVSAMSSLKNIPQLMGLTQIGRKSLLARQTNLNELEYGRYIKNEKPFSTDNRDEIERLTQTIVRLKEELNDKENRFKMLKNVVRKRSKSTFEEEKMMRNSEGKIIDNDYHSTIEKTNNIQSESNYKHNTDESIDNNMNNLDINDVDNNNNDDSNETHEIWLGKKVIKKGYLKKKRNHSPIFRSRFFVLNQDRILRYATDEDAAKNNNWRGEIWLDDIIKITNSSNQLGMVLVTPSHTIQIVAYRRDDLISWFQTLTKHHSKKESVVENESVFASDIDLNSLNDNENKEKKERQEKEEKTKSKQKQIRELIGKMIDTEEFFMEVDEKISEVLGDRDEILRKFQEKEEALAGGIKNDANKRRLLNKQSSLDDFFIEGDDRDTIVKLLDSGSDDDDEDDDGIIFGKDLEQDTIVDKRKSARIQHKIEVKRQKLEVTPQAILQIQDIIGSMTDLYSYILHLGEEWSMHLHSWLLEKLKENMTLPVQRPDLLMVIIQALKNENILFAGETINTIQEVIDKSFTSAQINERAGYDLSYPEGWDQYTGKTFLDFDDFLEGNKQKQQHRGSHRRTSSSNRPNSMKTPDINQQKKDRRTSFRLIDKIRRKSDVRTMLQGNEEDFEHEETEEERKQRMEETKLQADEELKNVLEIVKRMVHTLHLVVDELIPLLPPEFNILQLFQEKAETIISGTLKKFLAKYRYDMSISHVLTLLSWAEDHKAIMERFGISKFSEEFDRIKLFLLENYKNQVKTMIGLWIDRIIDMDHKTPVETFADGTKISAWPEDLIESLRQQLDIAARELQGDSSLIISIISLTSLNKFIENHVDLVKVKDPNQTSLEQLVAHVNNYSRFADLLNKEKRLCDNMEARIGDQMERTIDDQSHYFLEKASYFLTLACNDILYDIKAHLGRSLFTSEWENSTYAMETTKVTLDDYAGDCQVWLKQEYHFRFLLTECLKMIVITYISSLFNSRIRIKNSIKERLDQDYEILRSTFIKWYTVIPNDLIDRHLNPLKQAILLLKMDANNIVGHFESELSPIFGTKTASLMIQSALLMRGDSRAVVSALMGSFENEVDVHHEGIVKLLLIDHHKQLKRQSMRHK